MPDGQTWYVHAVCKHLYSLRVVLCHEIIHFPEKGHYRNDIKVPISEMNTITLSAVDTFQLLVRN